MDIEEKISIVTSFGYLASDANLWYEKYMRHVHGSQKRDLDSQLTFLQYVNKAAEADLPDVAWIGREKGQYVLGRIGDVGVYVVDNCRFIPQAQNHQEKFSNGRTDDGNLRRSIEMTGQTKETSDRLMKSSETKKGKTKITDEGHALQARKIAKNFILHSPDGQVHRGSNLSEFCQNNNLSQFALYDVFCRTTNTPQRLDRFLRLQLI